MSTHFIETDDSSPLAWQADALCAQADPEAFFPTKGGSTRDAKTICASCPVVAECLAYALDNNMDEGVWGGKSAVERREIRARQKMSQRRGRSGVTAQQRESSVRQGVAAGLSDGEIAAKYGMASRTVLRIRIRLGLESTHLPGSGVRQRA
jgi:WhiB family redox-sensing transcriptional regulator